MKFTASTTGISENQQPVANEQPSYSEDGVDITLIRRMLSLTPYERLQVLQQNLRSLTELMDESSFT